MNAAARLLSAEKIVKRYGSNEVLKGVTMNARAGDAISLIGSSGSGKSTFLPGQDVATAAAALLAEDLGPLGGSGGLIALGRDGRLAMPYNSSGMYRGWMREGQPWRTAIFESAADG